jgi:hypothetical protein
MNCAIEGLSQSFWEAMGSTADYGLMNVNSHATE